MVKQLVVKFVFLVSLVDIEKNLKKQTSGKYESTSMLGQNIIRLQIALASTIRKYRHDLDLLFERSWAIFWHKYSTNDDPHHDFCNIDWCGYLKSVRDGTPYNHAHHALPRPVLNAVRPVFDNLCSRESLARVLNASTQNPNEGFHSLVWLMSPKHKASSGTTFGIACSFAITIFNDGYFTLGKSIQVISQAFKTLIEMFIFMK